MLRSIYLFLLLLPSALGATGGPGNGSPVPTTGGLNLPDLIEQATAAARAHDARLEATPDAAESAALQSLFAAPTALSERGDDVRRIAALTDSAAARVAEAQALFRLVADPIRQVDSLTDELLSSLPLGITQDFGGTKVKIAFTQMRFLPTRAEVDLYLSLDFPNTDMDPIFVAEGVGWSRRSGFVGTPTLRLIADWGIDFADKASRMILRKSAGDGIDGNGTYFNVTCGGAVSGQIDATVLFSRDWFTPVGQDTTRGGELAPTLRGQIEDRVHADFQINFGADDGFFAEVTSNQTFFLTKRPDVEISIGTFAIDMSDTRNPSNMEYCANYTGTHANDQSGLWRGFYLSGLDIRLPEQYSSRDSALAIGANYLLIDRSGFTGLFYADNILRLNEKTAGGWPFSVEHFELSVTNSRFDYVRADGLLKVPLLNKAAGACQNPDAPFTPPSTNGGEIGDASPDECLGYTATIGRGTWAFGVVTEDSYCVNMWKADLEIRENSSITLAYAQGEFIAEATINGAITVDAKVSKGVGLQMERLTFDDLRISNQRPYLSPGRWGQTSITANLGKFELVLDSIHLVVNDTVPGAATEASLNFNAALNVDTKMRLNCEGMFSLRGTLQEQDDRQRWRFGRLKVHRFKVDASTSSWGIKAEIAFYENSTNWGNGFYGAGELRLESLGNVGVKAVAQFGSKNNPSGVREKYFFVDVMANLGSGVPIVPGIKLLGIGGGVYKNMSSRTVDETQSNYKNPSVAHQVNTKAMIDDGGFDPPPPGQRDPWDDYLGISTSGVKYRVDLENKFGAFIQLIIAGENEEAFSINARLDLDVRDDGGWRASLDGNVIIMGPVKYDINDRKIEEGVGIYVHMEYVKSSAYNGFKADADVFVKLNDGKIIGGHGVSFGATDVDMDEAGNAPAPSDSLQMDRQQFVGSTLGYAGGMTMEFSDQQWYIHVGHPGNGSPDSEERIKLAMLIGNSGVLATTYFCVGQNVPPIPPLPANVRRLTGDLDFSRDLAQYESANGFAFGASLELFSGGKYGIFYFDLEAGVGFDINVRNYGEAYCDDSSRGDKPIGVNGWYAAGQAWAYIAAEVGIDVKILFFRGRVSILEASVAAVLQMRGPNPIYGRGVLAGQYGVLGNRIRGNFRVEGEFGNKCQITGPGGADPVASLDIVSQITPADGSVDVEDNAAVSAFLLLPINEATNFGDDSYELNNLRVNVRQSGSSSEVPGQVTAADSSYTLRFVPDEYLSPATDYSIRIRGSIIKRNEDGRQIDNVAIDTTVRFTTAPVQFRIDAGNVEYSYPLAGQRNYLYEESSSNFIKLRRKQAAITDNVKVVYEHTRRGTVAVQDARWSNSGKRYEWAQPRGLQGENVYRVSLVRNYAPTMVAGGGGSGNGGNTGPGTTPTVPDAPVSNPGPIGPGGNSGVGLPDGGPSGADWFTDAPSELVDDEPSNQILLSYYFRTSRYGTLAQKLDAVFSQTELTDGSEVLVNTVENVESFDSFDARGYNLDNEPLIQLRVRSGETFLRRHYRENYYDVLPYSTDDHRGDYQWWQEDPSPPYKAVTLLFAGNLIGEGEYSSRRRVNDDRGVSLQVAFPYLVIEEADVVGLQAREAVDRELELAIRIYARDRDWYTTTQNSDGYQRRTPQQCYPNLGNHVLIEPFVPNGTEIVGTDGNTGVAAQLEQWEARLEMSIPFYVQNYRTEEFDVNAPLDRCPLDRKTVQLYKNTLQSYLARNLSGTSYPIEFKYVLPDGTETSTATVTFDR